MHVKQWLFLCLTALLLVGCSSAPTTVAEDIVPPATEVMEPVTETEPEQSLAQTMTTQDAPVQEEAPAPTFTLETITHSDSVFASEDASVLVARYDYYLPYLQANDPADDQALAIADSFNAQFTKWEEASGFAEIALWAQDHYESTMIDGLDWVGYYASELTTATYQTTGYISISGYYYSFTGGAHPNTVLMSWLFDLTSGTFASPLTLANDAQVFCDAVAVELIEQIQTPDADGFTLEEYYWDDYQSVLASWDSYCVYFDDAGMHIEFSPYELAAYAAGPQFFTIDYDTITPYLSEQALAALQPITQ